MNDTVLLVLVLVGWAGGSIVWGLFLSEEARERRAKDRIERENARRRRRERLAED